MRPLAAVFTIFVVLTVTAAALGQPATDPEAELVVAMPADTTNMAPRFGMGSIRSTYVRQVFESLVDVDAQGKPVPGLALAWKAVGDTAWEFSLRKGVKFHDGEAFNADTVLFNLDRMFRRNLDKHGIKDVAAGTQFDKTLPHVSREAAARLAARRAGQVSLVDAVPPLDAGVLAQDPKLKVVSGPQKLNCRLYLNGRPRDKFDSGGKDGLYADTRTRLALAYAVNRDAIIKKIFQGFAIANASPVATVSYGYVAQEPYPYDPKRSKALLAEAGWKDTGKGWERNGEPLILNLHFAAKHYGQAFDETTAAVAEMLKEIGVQVILKPVDFGSMLQITQKGTLPYNGGFAACRTSNNLDADDFLRDWTAFTLINWTPYPPELLALFTSTRRELDPGKRLRLLADLQRQVRDWVPVVPLYQEVKVYAHGARVVGFTPLTELHMDFRSVGVRK